MAGVDSSHRIATARQFDRRDPSVKLALSYLDELKEGTAQLRSFNNHIEARKSYQALLSVASSARGHCFRIPADQGLILSYDVEEAEVELEIAYAELYDRFNTLNAYANEQIRRAAEVGDRLVDLIQKYHDELGIVWPAGCHSLGNIHRFLGNREEEAASYRLGYDAIGMADNPEAFDGMETVLLRCLDAMLYSPTTAPKIEIEHLKPFLKTFVDEPLKERAKSWILWGVLLTLCFGVGIIGIIVGICMISKANSTGIESYGNLKYKRIR